MQTFATDRLRNVVLLSHSGAGKTSLTEAMLLASGAITRLGRVEEGSTTSDFEPEAIERRHSIQLALAPCVWREVKINVLDTPGYADFAGEALSAMAAADCAVLVVSAVDGVEVGTELMWREAEQRGLPRLVVINKMDRENADFYRTLAAVQQRLGKQCVAVNVPQGSQQGFTGVTSLLEAAKAGSDPRLAQLHEALSEAVAETDESLTEKYLREGDLTAAELAAGLKAGVAAGRVTPVLACSATKQTGVKEVLDALRDLAPSPAQRPPVEAGVSGAKVKLSAANANGPLAALVFKTSADVHVGKLSYFRVVSGTLKAESQAWNATKQQPERIGHTFVVRGKHEEPAAAFAPGDIGAIAKLQHATTGDTLAASKDASVTLPAIAFPEPVYSVAIAPKTKADMDKMGAALHRIVEEDPSLHVTREQGTAETVLSGLGEAHIDVAAKRLKRKFGVEVELSTPRVPYRETIARKTLAEFKHKKQSGGHGQYGHVVLELEPLPRGSGTQFEVRVVGGSVPREFSPRWRRACWRRRTKGCFPATRWWT